MNNRNKLGDFLNAHSLLGIGVEVGVFAGSFSEILLSTWKGKLLICVDSWGLKAPEFVHNRTRNTFLQNQMKNLPLKTQIRLRSFERAGKSRQIWEELFKATQERLKRFDGRVEFRRMFSIDAAKTFENDSLDFVYIDGDHRYEGIKQDLNAWWPKLKIGGLFSGHDYLDQIPVIEVKHAVSEFVADRRITGVQTTKDEKLYRSWYFFKQ